MVAFSLALLAVVDGVFAGFRAAAGRNARIDKRAYYRESLWRGALSGAALVLLLALLTAVVLACSPNAFLQYVELVRVGARMLFVLGAYATLVLLALVIYGTCDWNWRSLATVAILGPFTLLRPWVIGGAVAYGLADGAVCVTWLLTLVSSAAVILLGHVLDRSYKTAPISRNCPPSE